MFPLGAAMGIAGRARSSRVAEECHHRPTLFRYQRAHPLVSRCREWLFRAELAHLQASPRAWGHVRKGGRGTTVVYADRFVPDNERQRAHERGEAPHAIPFLKRFTVFNVEQCQDLPDGIAAGPPPVDTDLILPQVEALIRAIGADLRIGGDKAYYDVAGDFIRVPPPQAFYEPINWHRTVCHEHIHYAGAAHRLNRDLSGSFGSTKYAEEELVGEVGAAMLCAARGIVPTVRHADYLGTRIEVLPEDGRAIVRAASAASKAADYLLSFLPDAAASNMVQQKEHHEPSAPPPCPQRAHALCPSSL